MKELLTDFDNIVFTNIKDELEDHNRRWNSYVSKVMVLLRYLI